MVKVEIDSIRVSLMSQDRVVILKDVDSDRYLPIWIGAFEAEAIRIELANSPVARPLTHDLLKQVIQQLGGEVEHIVVNDLRNDVYYASLKVRMDDKVIEIDSRPSDAIALAVRLKVPLYVADAVMDRAGIEPEDEVDETAIEKPTSATASTGKDDPNTGESSEDLSIFKDFLDTLDLDDFEEN